MFFGFLLLLLTSLITVNITSAWVIVLIVKIMFLPRLILAVARNWCSPVLDVKKGRKCHATRYCA